MLRVLGKWSLEWGGGGVFYHLCLYYTVNIAYREGLCPRDGALEKIHGLSFFY